MIYDTASFFFMYTLEKETDQVLINPINSFINPFNPN